MSSTGSTPRPPARPGGNGGPTASASAQSAAGKAPTGKPSTAKPGSATARPKPKAGATPAKKPGSTGLVRPVPKAKVRRARLVLAKVSIWSVLKMAFLLSVGLGIITVVGAVVFWTVMDLTGIFDQVNQLFNTVLGTEGGGQTIQELVTLGQVASISTIIATLNVVVLTLLAVLGAALYNISASLVGGIGVTLTDD